MNAMDSTEAQRRIADAELLQALARKESRWFGTYLFIFGIASLVIGAFFAAFHDSSPTILVVAMFVWAFFVCATAWWANSKKIAGRGTMRLSALAFGVWGLLWAATCVLGSTVFTQTPWVWWAGGVTMAVWMIVCAAISWSRSGSTATRPSRG